MRYSDPETTKRLTFLTNNFTLPALSIPQLSKSRWYVELFVRWIRLALDVSLYKLLQILSITLFEKTPISIAVLDIGSQFDAIDDGNQLQLFDL